MKNATLLLALPLSLVACGGGEPDNNAPSENVTVAGAVNIVTPMNAGLINGTSVTVTLSSTVPIVPAGDLTPGTGHHHLFLDADLTGPTEPVPSVPGSIIHMGDASTSYTFENVSPGEHRIIAVVADGVHVPLQPWVVDTVTFTVSN